MIPHKTIQYNTIPQFCGVFLNSRDAPPCIYQMVEKKNCKKTLDNNLHRTTQSEE
jgi:hypothetical protein